MSVSEQLGTERFRGWIAQGLGLHFDDSKAGFLADVLARRAQATGQTPQGYLDALSVSAAGEELRVLASELTVPETYFFRHFDQFRAFAEVALPERLAARSDGVAIRVLSAGCASGEEPYSLAILMRERAADPYRACTVRAVDVNPAVLEKALRARYSSWAMRETPSAIRERWFRDEGREAALDERIRTAVTFEERNLALPDAQLWAPAAYDIIFCRNLLMYFTLEQAQMLVARLTHSLVPGGYLFLGHAETLRGLSNAYALRHTHGTFYYQRKDASLNLDAACVPHGDLPAPPIASPASETWAATWIETVQRASDRIDALTKRPAVARRAMNQPGAGSEVLAGAGLQVALELLRREQFAEALELLGRMPPHAAQDPDILLLRAALLTHSGQLSAAERACAELLERDELNTGGHYLLALCRESAGDRQGALEHDQAAIYLDPGFAMPRLHLGLVARRAGDRETACRELRRALMLLQREDASRLLLFGGGFGREALMALCRAELRAAGDEP